MNWLTLIAIRYHWEQRLNNELITLIWKELNEKAISGIEKW